MAGITIDACYRMADRLALRCSSTMAGMTRYTRAHNVGAGMVWVGIQKTDSSMTVTTLRVGDRVGAGWGVSGGGCHTCGYLAVVASGACPGNIRMIKAAVQCQV